MLSVRVGDAEDHVVAVLAHQQGSVWQFHGGNRTSPDMGVIDDKSRQEVFVVPGGLAILHVDAYQFIAGSQAAIPGAMESDDGIADERGREGGFSAAGLIKS